MPDVNVPAMLRRASVAVEYYCKERHGYDECCKAEAAYLDRLADAVEDWQRDPNVGRVTDLMVALKASLAGRRGLALLRGEVASGSRVVRVQAEVKLPLLPNFLRLSTNADGMIDVADVEDAALRALGAAWTEALLAHAAKRRAQR